MLIMFSLSFTFLFLLHPFSDDKTQLLDWIGLDNAFVCQLQATATEMTNLADRTYNTQLHARETGQAR